MIAPIITRLSILVLEIQDEKAIIMCACSNVTLACYMHIRICT